MSERTRHRTRPWWGIGLTVAVVLITAMVLIARCSPASEDSPTAPPVSSSSVAPPPAAPKPALVVKIDNVLAARPATGLGDADVIYVEPVEGGLTRLVAIYYDTTPAVVGPVRSARATDVELLGQYGRPVVAYSGAAPWLLPTLRTANLVNASPAEAPRAYYRASSRPAPHNLYVRPRQLPEGALAPAEPALQFGPASHPGTPLTRHDCDFRAASFAATWSPETHRWLVSMDGTPFTSTESGRLGAATVIEQRVATAISGSGGKSPIAHTVGQGKATVLRDGQRFDATWTRPSESAPTRFHTTAGTPVPLAPGPVWILLMPA